MFNWKRKTLVWTWSQLYRSAQRLKHVQFSLEMRNKKRSVAEGLSMNGFFCSQDVCGLPITICHLSLRLTKVGTEVVRKGTVRSFGMSHCFSEHNKLCMQIEAFLSRCRSSVAVAVYSMEMNNFHGAALTPVWAAHAEFCIWYHFNTQVYHNQTEAIFRKKK